MKQLPLIIAMLLIAAAAQAQVFTISSPAPAPAASQGSWLDLGSFIENKPAFAVPSRDVVAAINTIADFHAGDTLAFSYTLTNYTTKEQAIAWSADIRCPGLPQGFMVLDQMVLTPGQAVVKNFTGVVLPAEIESQACVAYVRLVQSYVAEVTRKFNISGLSRLKVGLVFAGNPTCASLPAAFLSVPSCVADKKVLFTRDSHILINPSSSGANWQSLNYTAILVNPSGLQKPITLPYVFSPDQVGVWTVLLSANSKGYSTGSTVVNIGVVDTVTPVRSNTIKTVNSGLTDFSSQY